MQRGGWFDKCQKLCALVLRNNMDDAYECADRLYTGPPLNTSSYDPAFEDIPIEGMHMHELGSDAIVDAQGSTPGML